MRNITRFLFLVVMTTSFSESFAQAADREHEVKDVIQKLFKAMELGDSTMLRSVFASQTTTATIFKDREGNVQLRREDSIDGFAKAVGTPHDETWYEEFWNVQVQFDGDFAQAWCDYAFYLGKKFSHCGVDAFHLYKTQEGWKIFHLADTRRRTDCNIPQETQDKYK